MYKISLGLILLFALLSCNRTKNEQNNQAKQIDNKSTEVQKSENLEDDDLNISKKQKVNNKKNTISLTRLDSTNLDSFSLSFPFSWERFGIDNNDTVTYRFCYANNPEFSIDKDFNSIQIIIGNELNETFKIENVFFNDSIFRIHIDKSSKWLDSCTIEIVNIEDMTAKFYLNDDFENSYQYLPKSILKNKRRIEEDCNDEDI